MQISPRCYAVTGLAYTPPWSVNAGFMAGGETTLIVDTGANAAAAQTILGYAVAVRPNNLTLAINTEEHFDHIGGNSYLLDQGIDILGHHAIARTDEEFAAEQREFAGLIPNPARRHESAVFYRGTRLANPTRPLTKEMQLDLGQCRVEIVFTPGHTPTNLSVWIPQERVLYCGDCLTNQYLPNLDASTPAEWPAWLDSLARIERLNPATIVCGHGAVITDVRAAIGAVAAVLREAIRRGVSPTGAATA